MGSSSTLELYGEVNNILDRAPPIDPSYSTFGTAPGQVNNSLFDVLGRRFTVGLKLRM